MLTWPSFQTRDEPIKLEVKLDYLIISRKLYKVLIVKKGLNEDVFSFDDTTLSARSI